MPGSIIRSIHLSRLIRLHALGLETVTADVSVGGDGDTDVTELFICKTPVLKKINNNIEVKSG